MNESRDVWVFVEQEAGELAEVSLELLSKGRELADRLGSQMSALLFGYGIAHLAEDVIHHGADTVLLADHPELAPYRSSPYARVAIDLARDRRPYIFLLGATPTGRDLAPRIASALRAGLTADCTDLQLGEYRKRDRVYHDLLLQIRPAFGGNVIATIVNPDMHPQLATVREGVMRIGLPTPEQASRQKAICGYEGEQRSDAIGCKADIEPGLQQPLAQRPGGIAFPGVHRDVVRAAQKLVGDQVQDQHAPRPEAIP